MPTAPAPFACLQAGSLPTAADPAGELPFPHGGVHLRREAALQAPTIQEPVRLGKEAGVQAGKISRAERGRFLDLRTVDRAPDQVGESLHRPIRPGQPPSTRKVFSALSACGQSDCMAARRSAVWKQTLSSAACASGPAARVRPNRAPRTSAASRAHPGRRRPERGLPPRCSATARRACWRKNTGRAEVRSWRCGLNSYTSGPRRDPR
jgi:hypothetical protein